MSSKNKLEYYTDEEGKIRWHVKNTGNHKVISAATEGFDSLRNAMDNYEQSLRPVAPEDTTYPEGSGPDASGHLIATDDGSAGEGQTITLEGQDFSEPLD
jgi:hypothetical protein